MEADKEIQEDESSQSSETKKQNQNEIEQKKLDKELVEELSDPTNGLLNNFLAEYETWQEALKSSRAKEKEYIDKCKKLFPVLKKVKGDQNMCLENIRRFEIEIMSYKERFSEVTERTDEVSRSFKEKKIKVEELHRKQEFGQQKLENADTLLKEENDKKVMAMYHDLEKLQQKHDETRAIVSEKFKENIALQESVRSIQNEKELEARKIIQVEQKTKEIHAKIRSEKSRNAEYERAISDHEIDIESEKKKLETKQEMKSTLTKQVEEVKSNLENTKRSVAKYSDVLDMLDTADLDLATHLAKQVAEQGKIQEQIKQEARLLQNSKAKLNRVTARRSDLEKKVGFLHIEFEKIEKMYNKAEKKREAIEQMVAGLASELSSQDDLQSAAQKQKQAFAREKQVLISLMNDQLNETANFKRAVFMEQSAVKSFQNEVASINEIKKNIRKKIADFKRRLKALENEKGMKELENCKILEHLAEKEVEISTLDKSIHESQLSLDKQDNLLDAVREDRNLYNKLLLEQRGEMENFKREFVSLNHQIRQVKLELHEKDQGFLIEHFNVDQVDKDVLVIRSKISGLQIKRTRIEKAIKQQEKQKEALSRIISDADDEQKNQKKQLDSVINEHRLLTNRLVRKNEELTKLYEELRILNSLFLKGQKSFQEKNQLIAANKFDSEKLSVEVVELQEQVSQYANESVKVIAQKEKEVLELKLKTAALAEELQKPINVHRWRRLQDTDPHTFKLIQDLQKMNKTILGNAQKITTADIDIVAQEEQYIELSKVVSRMPGNEAREQLRLYAESIQNKRGKLKKITNQLDLERIKVSELESAIQQLDKQRRLLDVDWIQSELNTLRENEQIDPNSNQRAHFVMNTLTKERRELEEHIMLEA